MKRTKRIGSEFNGGIVSHLFRGARESPAGIAIRSLESWEKGGGSCRVAVVRYAVYIIPARKLSILGTYLSISGPICSSEISRLSLFPLSVPSGSEDIGAHLQQSRLNWSRNLQKSVLGFEWRQI